LLGGNFLLSKESFQFSATAERDRRSIRPAILLVYGIVLSFHERILRSLSRSLAFLLLRGLLRFFESKSNMWIIFVRIPLHARSLYPSDTSRPLPSGGIFFFLFSDAMCRVEDREPPRNPAATPSGEFFFFRSACSFRAWCRLSISRDLNFFFFRPMRDPPCGVAFAYTAVQPPEVLCNFEVEEGMLF